MSDEFTRDDEIRHLCMGLGIEMEWYPEGSNKGRAWRGKRKVKLSHVKSEITYLLALHEIGHVVGSNPPLRLDQEVAAWEWALDHYDREPSSAVWASIARRLHSYLRAWEDRPGRRVTDRFLRFLDRIELSVETKAMEESGG